MRRTASIISSVVLMLVGLLFAVVGAFLCYIEFPGEQPDWPTVIIGMLLLLVGVGITWSRLIRVIRT